MIEDRRRPRWPAWVVQRLVSLAAGDHGDRWLREKDHHHDGTKTYPRERWLPKYVNCTESSHSRKPPATGR
jgi:hypothetical protein